MPSRPCLYGSGVAMYRAGPRCGPSHASGRRAMQPGRPQAEVERTVQDGATGVGATTERAPDAGPPSATQDRPGTDAVVAAAADVRAAVEVLREALREQALLVASLIEENADLRRRAGEQQRTITEPER